MPFTYILANLVADNPGATGALFVDDTGETVDLAAGTTPGDMKVLGAYMGIYLRHFEQFLPEDRYGAMELLHIESRGTHLYAKPLAEGYFLVRVQRTPAPVARARRSLREASERLHQELFVEP